VSDDWSPSDPDAENVYYDLSAWTPEQEAELTEALVEGGVPHGWNDRELVVPEHSEDEADRIIELVEERLGIDGTQDAVAVSVEFDPDAPTTEYELENWPVNDRRVLSEALVHVRIPHRWEGATLLVPTAAEEVVDDLLDDIEGGEVTIIDDGNGLDPSDEIGASGEAPDEDEDLMGLLFTAGDRLARDPLDADGLDALARSLAVVDAERPPFGIAPADWSAVADLADRLGDALAGQETPDAVVAIELAEELRDLTRPA
jgi:hypothetical protein